MSDSAAAFTGHCNCLNLQLHLAWPAEAEAIPARACDCSFCQSRGLRWTSHPQARLQLRIADESRVIRHRFATQTAEFLCCRDCDQVLAALSRIDGRDYAVVNVGCLIGLDPKRLRSTSVSFQGEAQADRLARRQRGWIGQVELRIGAVARWPGQRAVW